MMNMANINSMAGITATSHKIPCSTKGDWDTAFFSSNPTKASTKPGTTPPSAIPALKKIPVSAFTIPEILLPVVYSP